MFGKKKEAELGENPDDGGGAKAESEAGKQDSKSAGPLSLAQLSAEVDKLTAQFSSFYEMQKASTERFSRINEQIGELRAMLIERDRASQHLEAKATQAIDLVESVQPEKLMIEVRRGDSRIEAIKANLESNEVIMTNIMNELRDMRNQLKAFKGMDEVVKMNDEVKKELAQIKLVESVVERHADKVDTVFAEIQKSFSDYMKLSSTLKSVDQSSKQMTNDVDAIKVNLKEAASKKDVSLLTGRVEEFEKKVGGYVTLLNERFEGMEKKTTERVDTQLEKSAKLLKGFDNLAQKVPDLDKYFNLLSEEAKKKSKEDSGSQEQEAQTGEPAEEAPKVEKIKQPGSGSDPLKEAQPEKKGAGLKGVKLPGLFGKKQ